MELSIIVPVYNVEKYLDQCLNSLLNQGIKINDYEIILIDDGSTDNSFKIAKKISVKHENIILYQQKNQGLSITRNNGLKYAKGKYVYFVDSDDYIASNTLNQLIEVVNDYKLEILEFKNKITKSRDLLTSNTDYKLTKNLNILNGNKYICSRSFNDSVCVYFYLREFLINSKVKFLEGKLMEDMIFNAEIISLANRIAYYPLDVYRYIINTNSIWTKTDPIHLRKSINDFIFMAIKYSELIKKLENKDVDTLILRNKLRNMVFNISKRLLKSDFSFSEINQVFKKLYENNLYPIKESNSKSIYNKIITKLFNNKFMFFVFITFYRLFKKPIEQIIIKKYQDKKEKQIISSFNNKL